MYWKVLGRQNNQNKTIYIFVERDNMKLDMVKEGVKN